jgi:hypothetical protein
MRILLVEDDSRIANFVAKGLREQAHTVDAAANGKEALYIALVNGEDRPARNHSFAIRLHHRLDAPIGDEPYHRDHNVKCDRNPWAHEGQRNCQHVNQ